MINRRNIRIKALQVIYSFDLAGISPTPTEINKALKTKFSQTSDLLNYLVTLTADVARYVEIYSNKKASKHLPTAADLAINIKLAGNEVLWQLLENNSFNVACKNSKTESVIDKEVVKKLFLTLEQSAIYSEYIKADQRNVQEDKTIIKYIFNELILQDEEIITNIGELFNNFDDDIEMIQTIMNQTFDKPKSTHFLKIITPDKEIYANELVKAYYEKQEVVMEIIKPKLKNWDHERVAKIDMVILQLGINELLYFETIPIKVTINEYIDIAKDYSTPQSGQFVNGILDTINKELSSQGKLQKTDFRNS
jgi:transcription antitermination protein NusB